jgi:hypothetical protein
MKDVELIEEPGEVNAASTPASGGNDGKIKKFEGILRDSSSVLDCLLAEHVPTRCHDIISAPRS